MRRTRGVSAGLLDPGNAWAFAVTAGLGEKTAFRDRAEKLRRAAEQAPRRDGEPGDA